MKLKWMIKIILFLNQKSSYTNIKKKILSYPEFKIFKGDFVIIKGFRTKEKQLGLIYY